MAAVTALLAESAGHVEAVAAMTGDDLGPLPGARAFVGDGLGAVIASAASRGRRRDDGLHARAVGVLAATRVVLDR